MPEIALLEFDLTPLADEGGTLRVTNRNGNEVQRAHIIDRSKSYVVQADLAEVVHGKFSKRDDGSEEEEEEEEDDDDDSATLIVLDFTVTIDVIFGDETGRLSEGPNIANISPKNHFTMRPTNSHIEVKRSVQMSVQGGPAPVSGGLSWETTASKEKQDQTSLSGVVRFEGRRFGEKNAARWVLMENSSQQTGIPTFLRSLILLRRQDSSKFTAIVKIEVKVSFDINTILTGLFQKKEQDDPVIFDPKKKSITTWAKDNSIDVKNLESTPLEKFHTILSTTMYNDIVK